MGAPKNMIVVRRPGPHFDRAPAGTFSATR
jgi:hypothetical protein